MDNENRQFDPKLTEAEWDEISSYKAFQAMRSKAINEQMSQKFRDEYVQPAQNADYTDPTVEAPVKMSNFGYQGAIDYQEKLKAEYDTVITPETPVYGKTYKRSLEDAERYRQSLPGYDIRKEMESTGQMMSIPKPTYTASEIGYTQREFDQAEKLHRKSINARKREEAKNARPDFNKYYENELREAWEEQLKEGNVTAEFDVQLAQKQLPDLDKVHKKAEMRYHTALKRWYQRTQGRKLGLRPGKGRRRYG